MISRRLQPARISRISMAECGGSVHSVHLQRRRSRTPRHVWNPQNVPTSFNFKLSPPFYPRFLPRFFSFSLVSSPPNLSKYSLAVNLSTTFTSSPMMPSQLPQPATAESGTITQPAALDNTYTSDTSLQRSLKCRFLFFVYSDKSSIS